ncbi:MAG TPA: tetratricopeptide repeat protein [Candidatus Acidoferrum sp.]|nr:tetratricopeptide repeat protein [Candidatus Acidoferrum sp.]
MSGTVHLVIVAAWIVGLGAGAARCGKDLRGQAAAPEAGPLGQARDLLARGDVEKAERTVREFLSQNQASADGHFLLGLILFRKIQADALEGRAAHAKGGQTGAESVTSREALARASLAEYTEGARYRKPSASDLKIVALDYVLLGSYGDASKWLERSVEDDPRDAEAWYYLGRAKYNENRFEEAVRAFEQCLAIEPRNVKAQSNLGLSYAGLNLVGQAQEAFLQAIRWQSAASRKDPEAYIGLGDLLIQQNRASEAVPYLLEAVDIAPRESRAREKLGSAYLNLDRLAEAQGQLEAAIALDTQNASLHYLLGSVYRKQGQAEKARTEFDRFKTLKEAAGAVQP